MKTTNREFITGLLLGLAILLLFNIAVAFSTQPTLQHKQGESVIYEDGSIDLQPATRQPLQNTINGKTLQG